MEKNKRRVIACLMIGPFIVALLLSCTSSTKSIETTKLQEQDTKLEESKKKIDWVLVKRSIAACKEESGIEIMSPNISDKTIIDCLIPYPLPQPKIYKYQWWGLLGSVASTPQTSAPPYKNIVTSVYDYLLKTDSERKGYGLYSYVLFPVYSERAELFLNELFRSSGYSLDSLIGLERLNAIYLPTRLSSWLFLDSKRSSRSNPESEQFAIELYDYSLAQMLLSRICFEPDETISKVCTSDLSRGPYLFTYRHPISTLSKVPPPFLFLDLSSVRARAFGEFIMAYKEQVKRPDFTDKERIESIELSILNIILTAADWIEPAKKALSDLIHSAKGENSAQ